MAIVALPWAVPTPVAAQTSAGITILTGEFGSLGSKRKLSIAAALQQLCGLSGESCSVFCSETSFGLYRLGRKPICRVAYRCPDGATRSVEAAKEELILLRCADDEEESIEAAGQPAVITDEPQPPPYVPTSSGK